MKNKLPEQTLFNDLSQLIEQSKNFVIVQANSVMSMPFWNVGKRINEDILQNKRADYGKQIVDMLHIYHFMDKFYLTGKIHSPLTGCISQCFYLHRKSYTLYNPLFHT